MQNADKLETAFRIFDKNGNNLISLEEIKELLSEFKEVDEE